MPFDINDLFRYLLLINTDRDVNRAAVEEKRRELTYRGVGATLAMGAGLLMVAAVVVTWTLRLTGVI